MAERKQLIRRRMPLPSTASAITAASFVEDTKVKIEQKQFRKMAVSMNIAAVICGGLVFLSARLSNIPVYTWIFGNSIGITDVIAATVSLILLWYLMMQGKTIILRFLAGFQIAMILLSVTINHYPNIVILKAGHLSLVELRGHDKTIEALGMALLLGSVFILPALFYLIYSFQRRKDQTPLT